MDLTAEPWVCFRGSSALAVAKRKATHLGASAVPLVLSSRLVPSLDLGLEGSSKGPPAQTAALWRVEGWVGTSPDQWFLSRAGGRAILPGGPLAASWALNKGVWQYE